MNYFEYFSEIEERFSRRRGSILLLNTLDWALIETWREAGIPLEAVLRGIDAAFDKYEARAHKARGRLRKVNGLAWCAQAVMQSAEELVEASTGLAPTTAREPRESGFESERVATLPRPQRRKPSKPPSTGCPHLDSEMRVSALPPPPPASANSPPPCASPRPPATRRPRPHPHRARRKTLRRAPILRHRTRARRPQSPGRPRARSLSREDVRRAAPPGAAAVSAQASPRTPRSPAPQPVLHEPRMSETLHIDRALYSGNGLALTRARRHRDGPLHAPRRNRRSHRPPTPATKPSCSASSRPRPIACPRPARTSAPAAAATTRWPTTPSSFVSSNPSSPNCSTAPASSPHPNPSMHSAEPWGYRNRIRLRVARRSAAAMTRTRKAPSASATTATPPPTSFPSPPASSPRPFSGPPRSPSSPPQPKTATSPTGSTPPPKSSSSATTP